MSEAETSERRTVPLEEFKRMSPEARAERGLWVKVPTQATPVHAQHVAPRLTEVASRPWPWRLLTLSRLQLVRLGRVFQYVNRQTRPWFDTW